MKRKKNNAKTAQLAVIYARFSSSNQREESILAQLRACEEYAAKHGFQIVGTYTDSARSALTADREQFQQMIEDSATGKFGIVLVHKMDRFSRDKYDSVTYKRKLRMNGVSVVSVLENIDGSAEGVILESLLEGMAQYYSMNLAREVMKGMKESALNCTHLGGVPPLGYDVDPITRKYMVNEAEAKIVRIIFQEYASGSKGYSQMLSYLNGMGYKTKRGNAFGGNSLHSILKNEKYIGVYTFNLRKEKNAFGKRNPEWNDESEIIRIEGGLPAIIDRETFDIVQAKLEGNLKHGGRHKAKEIYLLSGLAVCGECGAALFGNTRYCGRGKSKYASYRCSNRAQHKGCTNKELRKEYLESYVLDELYSKLFSEASVTKLARMLTDYADKKRLAVRDDLDLTRSALQEINSQISGIIQIVTESGISVDTVREKLRELESQKLALDERIKELRFAQVEISVDEEQIQELVNQSRHFVETKNIAECRHFIESYIEKVLVFHDRVEVRFKIHVPDDGNSLHPLTSEEKILTLRSDYKAG